MELIILEWIACLLCIWGGFMIARKDIRGFAVTGFADILLMYYGILTFQFGVLTLAFFYAIINIYGIYYWLKNK
jgi:TRAP-type C4-dicarboxylate transport system permease small subunit